MGKIKQAASKTKALAIATARANAGMAQDIMTEIADNYFEHGMDLQEAIDAAKDAIAQRAIERYGDKIRAALARAGLDVPADEPLTVDGIKAAVVEKTGLDLEDLTAEHLLDAADKLASQKLSADLGIEITSVMNGDTLAEVIKAEVRKAIDDGRAFELIKKGISMKARIAMTWKRAGLGETAEDRERAYNAARQKRYRRRFKEVWDV